MLSCTKLRDCKSCKAAESTGDSSGILATADANGPVDGLAASSTKTVIAGDGLLPFQKNNLQRNLYSEQKRHAIR